MFAVSALGRGRAMAEALMIDSCVIRHRTGTTTDDNTGEVTDTFEDIYTGRCKVQQQGLGGAGRPASPGQDYQILLNLEIHVPISVQDVQVGDVVEVTASVLDPDLAGKLFVVRDLFGKTYATARRLGVVRRTS